MAKTYIAKEESVQDIITKTGTTTDSVGSTSTGSVMAKLNKIISDVGTHMNRWTSARAEKLDGIGVTNDSKDSASTTTGTIMGKLNFILNSVNVNNSGSATGTLSQKLSSLIDTIGTKTASNSTGESANVHNKLNYVTNNMLKTNMWSDSRAARLDNLDALISSRAPSSTALSTAQWTNTRAGYLDKLNTGVTAKLPAITTILARAQRNGSTYTSFTLNTTTLVLLKCEYISGTADVGIMSTNSQGVTYGLWAINNSGVAYFSLSSSRLANHGVYILPSGTYYVYVASNSVYVTLSGIPLN